MKFEKMKIIASISAILLCATLLSNCKKLIYRDIDCRSFTLSEELFWNPANNGDSIVFINSENMRNKFIVVDKNVLHRTKYTSDTGCGCLDESSMLMTNNTDSIWFKKSLRYVESNTETSQEDVVFNFDGIQSSFYETHITCLSSFSIDSLSFTSVKKFEYSYSNNLNVKTVYLVKNLGIIQYEMVNGEIWTKENLSEFETTQLNSFTFTEDTCE